ncbi:MAG: hypothetical protein KF891_12345 [Rhizobacter sp.]|nr:hypothetical protein [Rhizobacter sp.]
MDTRHALSRAVMQLLQPLVRVLLRHGMAYDEFAELARRAYVRVAERDFTLERRKQTTSRISVITGLNRKEVARLQALDALGDAEGSEVTRTMNRAARVVAGWRHEHGGIGGPAPLDAEQFGALVKRHSGDMPARAVLDELRHAGAVNVAEDGRYRLAPEGYGPKAPDAQRLALLGEHAAELLGAIEHNHAHPPEDAWLQRRVFAEHIPAEQVETVRAQLKAHGLNALAQARTTLTAHDAGDAAPADGSRRVVLGVYYFEQPTRPAPPPAAPQGDTE